MTPITGPSPATAVPDAIVAMPGQTSVQQPATGLRPGGRDGPLPGVRRRGNSNLAPPPGQAPGGGAAGRRRGRRAAPAGQACPRQALPPVPVRGLTRGAMANGRCRCTAAKAPGRAPPRDFHARGRAHHARDDAQTGPGAKYRVHTRHCPWWSARRGRLMASGCARICPGDCRRRRFRRSWRGPSHPSQVAFEAKAASTACSGARVPTVRVGWPGIPGTSSESPGQLPRGRRHARRDGMRGGGSPRRRRGGPHGRRAEPVWARAEAAVLAPWRAAIKRARMIRRLIASRDRAAGENSDANALTSLRPGTCPSGGGGGGTAAVRAGAPAVALPRGGAASEGSATQPMNSGAGGGTAAARAEAPAAAVAAKGGAASEGSATKPMNSDAGGGTAAARAEALPRPLPPKAGRQAKVPGLDP